MAAAHPMEGEMPLPMYDQPEKPQLDRYQRIEVLSRTEGFLPVSKREQVEVLSLQNFINFKGGAAKHLAEVDRRQHGTRMADPNRTTRRIVREYIGYAKDSSASAEAMSELRDELSNDVNPELSMELVAEPTNRGVLAFLRYFDLSTLRDEGRFDKIGYDPQKVKYIPINDGIVFYAAEALASWRVHQVRKKLPEALASEGARCAFWLKRLVEVRDHSSRQLSAIANEGLDEFYGRIKEDSAVE